MPKKPLSKRRPFKVGTHTRRMPDGTVVTLTVYDNRKKAKRGRN
jgi:hypothetical protein